MSVSGDAAICALGFDVGARRTGVAVGNTLSGTARPLEVVEMRNGEPDWSRLDRLLAEWNPQQLVVGEPLTLEGDTQPAAERARGFARRLRARYGLPVAMVDERSSSREADRRFAQARRDGHARRSHATQLDAMAAQIILERWLAGS
ncbi:MAG: Holliday junction resolvase RuvX [Aquimonas sp.]|nr:Holliday junction resolvase RuvX [Aquimonas sp.]